MKLNYFQLISPDPIRIKNVGGVVSPKLRDISRIGIDTYNYYLSVLLMNAEDFYKSTDRLSEYEHMPDYKKSALNVFELMISREDYRKLLEDILNFFIEEPVCFYGKYKCFFTSDTVTDVESTNVVGYITKENYSDLCNIILQRNKIEREQEVDFSKIKSKKALEIAQKLQKHKKESQKNKKIDKKMELGNIVSSVANRSPSLNMANIWDLTVYQVWDSFSRLTTNNIYDIQSTSVAVWGNKDKTFDAATWYQRIDTDN